MRVHTLQLQTQVYFYFANKCVNYNEEMKVTLSSIVQMKKIWLHVWRLSWKKCITKKKRKKNNNKAKQTRNCRNQLCTYSTQTHTRTHTQIHEQWQQNKRTICAPLERQTASPLPLATHRSAQQFVERTAEQLAARSQCAFAAFALSFITLSLSCMGEALCLYMVRFHFVLVPLCLT